MLLSELARPTRHELIGRDVEVKELIYNSRKVKNGDVFCCIVGTFADGHKYAQQAVDAGAAALVVERRLPLDVPQLLVPNTRVAMAEMAAGYYGYKWAEELDADAFKAFKETGIFNKKTADKFLHMLQAGDTVDPMELYVGFRGKKPTVDALLERDGIKK